MASFLELVCSALGFSFFGSRLSSPHEDVYSSQKVKQESGPETAVTVEIWSSPVSWVCPHRDLPSRGGEVGWWEPGGLLPSYCVRAVLWMWGVRAAGRVSVSAAACAGTVQCAESSGAAQGVGGRKRSRASWQDVRRRNREPAGATCRGRRSWDGWPPEVTFAPTFDANDLYQGQNFNKVLSSLVTLNKVTADIGLGSDSVCARPSSHRIKSFDSLGPQPAHGRTSQLFQGQYRSLDMTDNSNNQLVVRAKFNFQQTNEDELSFSKGDVIHVTRVEEGGWWEGTHNGRTGWFPSNYVREVKPSEKPVSPKSGTLKSPPKGFDTTAINKSYYNVVLQNILETENEYSKELQTVLSTYLRPLQTSEKLSSANTSHLMGNLEEICSFQQMLVQSLEECTKMPEAQQRVGGCFLSLMPQMKTLYLAYCANHPSAVSVLTEHSEELGEFMELKGASSPGILVLTTGLSKPFMRLDKYPALLKELERHMEDYHPDRQDIQKSMTAFKNLSAQCQEVRKRKELELQILTEAIRSWEGDDIKTLGSVVYMSQVLIQCAGSEEKNERYLLLFPNILLMLSASPRMSGFIYQGKLPTTGMTVTKLEDSENHRNAFEISGSMIERILVSCNNQQDLHEWVDRLQKQTKAASAGNPSSKPHSVPSHTLPSHSITPSSKHADSKPAPLTPAYHTLPHPSHHGTPHTTINWGPLEPPKTPKPWSLSCLRPAPPLRPSAALCYKEDLSKSPKTMKKLLPKRKPERKPSDEEFALRKSTAALEEDAQILKVIEAYCTSAKTRQTLNSSL
ncbi:rho guanine nucleotide exchange factor 7 isoform X5 [Ovis aries]|uniref:rho guanine nucleotide exchange factor 7 isoform X5 n=1 Tax=Ovis aries TaxID=9940 RepID=UPI001C2ED392|nr:rho guanine nucleotide exchange factor 7 isoform X5 [Ovis aries]